MDADLASDIGNALEYIERDILEFEKTRPIGGAARARMEQIMRGAHSLKGLLALAEMPASSSLIHAVESLVHRLKERGGTLGREECSAVLDAKDAISRAVAALRDDSRGCRSIKARLDALAGGGAPPKADTPAPAPAPEPSAVPAAPRVMPSFPFPAGEEVFHRCEIARSRGLRPFYVEKAVRGDIDAAAFAALPIREDLDALGEFLGVCPDHGAIDGSRREVVVMIAYATSRSHEDVEDRVFDPFVWCAWPEAPEKKPEIPVAAPRVAEDEAEPGRKILIAEDEFVSRSLLLALLRGFGECDVAVNGKEAAEAFEAMLEAGTPYRLVCLDIMMPEVDGNQALRDIRAAESRHGIHGDGRAKVVMTTALSGYENLHRSFELGCDSYLVKPILKEALLRELSRLGVGPVGARRSS